MKRVLGVLTLLVLSAGACARGPEVQLLSSNDLPKELYNPGAAAGGSMRTARASIFFARTDETGMLLDPARLGAVTRVERTDRPIAEFVMRQLLRGPNPSEQPRLRTALPIGTELLGVTIRNRVAIVNLSAQFEAAGAEVLHLLRIAQVVWTLTDLPSVDAVQFRIHGAPQSVIDQNGIAHDLVGQARYSRYAPSEPGAQAPDVGGDVAPDEP